MATNTNDQAAPRGPGAPRKPLGQARTVQVGFRLRPEVAAQLGATAKERNARVREIVEGWVRERAPWT